MEALKVQNQIRQNAEEISGFFHDLAKWEKDIKLKDKKIQEKKHTNLPVRGAGTVKIQSTSNSIASHTPVIKSNSAAQHTYDIGYDRWNKLDENELIESIESPTNLTPAHLLPNIPQISKVSYFFYCINV